MFSVLFMIRRHASVHCIYPFLECISLFPCALTLLPPTTTAHPLHTEKDHFRPIRPVLSTRRWTVTRGSSLRLDSETQTETAAGSTNSTRRRLCPTQGPHLPCLAQGSTSSANPWHQEFCNQEVIPVSSTRRSSCRPDESSSETPNPTTSSPGQDPIRHIERRRVQPQHPRTSNTSRLASANV